MAQHARRPTEGIVRKTGQKSGDFLSSVGRQVPGWLQLARVLCALAQGHISQSGTLFLGVVGLPAARGLKGLSTITWHPGDSF